MKLGIFNEFDGLEKNYVKACEELKVDYEIIDILSSNWVENVMNSDCDGYLVRPSYQKEVWKTMYDEKLYYISKVLNRKIYPSYDELKLYENKKNMSYWLEINKISHPKTWVFYTKKEAVEFVGQYNQYPLVFKTNIGSAGIGVSFIKNKKGALRLIEKVFTKWRFWNRGYLKWYKTRFKIKYPIMDDKQYNYVIFQEKIDVKYEWRIIKIGESYFGHQKLAKGGYHSGSGLVGWVAPPINLLEFAKKICDIGNFNSMDIDVFEGYDGNYYVNELQTVFGSYNDSQMYIDGVPGRYIFKESKWVFEEGKFNRNGSFNLRVNDFINLLSKSDANEDKKGVTYVGKNEEFCKKNNTNH